MPLLLRSGRIRLAALGSLLASGCQGDAATICDKADECGLLNESTEECVDRIENLIEDQVVTDEETSDCAECYDDNSCGELRGGDCVRVCLGPFFD